MGNFCYIEGTECPYATVMGSCKYEDSGLCTMHGDDMPDEKKNKASEENKVFKLRDYGMSMLFNINFGKI